MSSCYLSICNLISFQAVCIQSPTLIDMLCVAGLEVLCVFSHLTPLQDQAYLKDDSVLQSCVVQKECVCFCNSWLLYHFGLAEFLIETFIVPFLRANYHLGMCLVIVWLCGFGNAEWMNTHQFIMKDFKFLLGTDAFFYSFIFIGYFETFYVGTSYLLKSLIFSYGSILNMVNWS